MAIGAQVEGDMKADRRKTVERQREGSGSCAAEEEQDKDDGPREEELTLIGRRPAVGSSINSIDSRLQPQQQKREHTSRK